MLSPLLSEQGRGGGVGSFRSMKGPLSLLCTLVLLVLASCVDFRQDPDPTPTTPISSILPTFQFAWTDTAKLTANFDSLVVNKSLPYTARFSQPTQGQLTIDGGLLRYEPTQANWHRDSCSYTLCQGDACGTGKIVFVNPAHTASCIPLPALKLNVAAALGGFTVQVVPTGSNGQVVNAVSEHGYTVDTLLGSNSKGLEYFAAGGGDTTNWGFDRVTYRWEEGVTCHEGVIEVSIGDTALPGARPFTSAATSAHFIPYDTLALHSHGDRTGQIADGIFYLKGRQLQLPTTFGTVSDTTIGGIRGYYYRRTVPGAQPDKFDYYYIHTSDFTNRVTRATITLAF